MIIRMCLSFDPGSYSSAIGQTEVCTIVVRLMATKLPEAEWWQDCICDNTVTPFETDVIFDMCLDRQIT